MKKELEVYLEDIIESCNIISQYIEGRTKEEFVEDIGLQDSVIRRLEIIGEAVKRLPPEFRNQHPDIPWRGATGMRDILIHMYDEVETEQVWKTITTVLPHFKKQIEQLL